MKYVRSSRGLIVCAFVVLAAVGCHSTSEEVVRSHASFDLACAESKIQVKPTKDSGTFHAEGCGKSRTYTCEGWDSYNQAPVCAPAR
jgi:hypothetical protein